MARELRSYQVTVPAGTAQATPQVSSLDTSPRLLHRIEVKVPPGPHGQVGFQFGMANRQLIPYNSGQFVVADDDLLVWDFDDLPSSGAWQFIAYNLGQFAHTLYIRLFLELPGEQLSAGPAPLELGGLGGDGSSSAGGDGSGVPPPPPDQLPPPDLPPPDQLPPPPGLPGDQPPGQVQPFPWPGPVAWPLSQQDLTGLEL